MSQNKVAELCCIVNGNETCRGCKEKVCSDHSKEFQVKAPCRCGSCNDTEPAYYCLPCVTKYEPEDYNND